MIRLSAQDEPQIYNMTRRFGTILENVVIDLETRQIDLNDDSITENTRASYLLSEIENFEPTGMGGHPKDVVFLNSRRIRCTASHLTINARPSHVSLFVRLHSQGGWNGKTIKRTPGHI